MLRIERAIPENAEELTRIALTAKKHWGYPDDWIKAWSNTLRIQPDFISASETYTACVDDEIAGFYSLVDAAGQVHLAHLWIRPDQMRRGIGRSLFEHAAQRARHMNTQWIEIESDPNAEGFYLRQGPRRIQILRTEWMGQIREIPLLRYDIESKM